MVIEINMDFLALHNLQPNEYVYLYAKYYNISIPFKSLKMNLKKLEEDGYIKITGKELVSKNIAIRKKFINLIEGDFDRMFCELLSRYPIKVGHKGKYRILHAANPDAKANKKVKEKYRKLVENKPDLHNKIINLLDVQLSHQRDSLQYMQMLEVWVNSRTWEKWEGFDNMEEQDGTRNTKQLD